ncbi:glycine betaine ABC transporter substrate-binding protein [Aquibacillus saliphilus]|uniref:glycine betaine ABC transporter substrate-binding protein n=1 Tax=Aquibacillus saliphilus TaxID=1909422 RepID=UPI001CF04FF3|nr:glycine betaine ABC transporter substrate-binding protein [Aquibacillus saliphilus]
MKKIVFNLIAMLFLTLIVGCGAGGEGDTEGTEQGNQEEDQANQENVGDGQTITFGVTPWTSTIPPTEIASMILEDMGYTVESVEANVGGVFMGLSRGELDVFMDSWLPMHETYFEKFEEDIVDTAVSYPEAETGWTVPTYLEDINSVEDIVGNEDMFDNEFYGIEEGAGASIESDEIIEAYELNMKQVNSSEGGMLAQAQRKMNQEDPVVFYGWRPHTMFNKFDLKVLTNEKGFFETSSIHVITTKDLEERAPEAYEFLSNWSISIDDVEKMIVQIEEEGQDAETVAREWIENNQDKVNEMTGN